MIIEDFSIEQEEKAVKARSAKQKRRKSRLSKVNTGDLSHSHQKLIKSDSVQEISGAVAVVMKEDKQAKSSLERSPIGRISLDRSPVSRDQSRLMSYSESRVEQRNH